MSKQIIEDGFVKSKSETPKEFSAIRARSLHLSAFSVLRIALPIAAILILSYALLLLLPNAPNFVPTDYEVMRQWGLAAQKGTYYSYYPLPALLYVFLPLSLMPSWFAFVWITFPFLLLLYLFRKNALVLWVYVPTLVNAAWGQLDGYLIAPLYWLLTDHPGLAGISAAILSLKPQLAVFTVPFMLYRWYRNRNWKSLRRFGLTMLLLYLPAFLVDPLWPIRLIPALQERASLWFLSIRGVTLWSWWWHGDWTVWALPLLVALVVALFYRAFQKESVRALHVLGLLVQPVLFVVSLDTIIAAVRPSTRNFFILVVLSWLAFALDVFMAWGGVYVLLSLAALWLIGSEKCPPNAWVAHGFGA